MQSNVEKSAVKNILWMVFRWITWRITKICSCFSNHSNRNLLLVCNDILMAYHLHEFWDLFRDDSRLNFRIAISAECAEHQCVSIRRLLPVLEMDVHWAFARHWDLVIDADHSYHIAAAKRNPTVFIGHGPQGKIGKYESRPYNYSQGAFDKKGCPKYVCMFDVREEDRERAVVLYPKLKDVIAVVGSLSNDRLLAEVERRRVFRNQFRFTDYDKVVFILSSWGEDCLLHTMGEDLVSAAISLADKYKFIISAHPHEYRSRPDGQRVWGEYLRTLSRDCFVVREPSESWIPYMIAADIVLSDFTCLLQSSALLQKPIILTSVPEERIWRGSVTWEIRQFAPIISDAKELGGRLEQIVLGDYPFDQLEELSKRICPDPGQAGDRIKQEIYRLLKLAPLQVDR